MPSSNNHSVTLGATVLMGLALSLVCFNKLLGPMIIILGIFVGLPLFWRLFVMKTFNEPLHQALIMLVAFFLIIGVGSCF